MATPTTDLAIVNLGLDRIGQKSVTSIVTPSTEIEEACSRNWDQTRREVFEGFEFNCTRKLATLTADVTEDPAFGFSSAYAQPNDFIKLLTLGDISIGANTPANLYTLSAGFIYTDYADGEAGALNVQYVHDLRTVTKYDPLLIELLKLKFAQNVAYKFTLKPSLLQGLEAQILKVETRASAVAAQQKPPQRIERSRVRDVRRGGGSRRDTTRYSV